MPGVLAVQPPVQARQLTGPAGERRDRGRELPRNDRSWPVPGITELASQQLGVHLLQLAARPDAQLLGQPGAGRRVALDRLGVAPGAVQGQHLHLHQRLDQREPLDGGPYPGDHGVDLAQAHREPAPGDQHLQGLGLQAGAEPLRPRSRHPAQRRSRPQVEGPPEELRAFLFRQVSSRGAVPQRPEHHEVEAAGGDLEDVSARAALHVRPLGRRPVDGEPGVGQGPPQPGDEDVERAARRGWRLVAPDARDQRFQRDRAPGLGRQHGQQRPLLRGPDVHGGAAGPERHRAQHPQHRLGVGDHHAFDLVAHRHPPPGTRDERSD